MTVFSRTIHVAAPGMQLHGFFFLIHFALANTIQTHKTIFLYLWEYCFVGLWVLCIFVKSIQKWDYLTQLVHDRTFF